MTFGQRSLFGRHALLLIGLLVLGQVISAVLVREMVVKPRFERVADGLACNVSAIRAGLPAAERSAFVERFSQHALAEASTRSVQATASLGLLTPLRRRFMQVVSQRVAGEGGEVVWRREAGGSLAVRIALDGKSYWIVLPGVLPAHEFTGTWLAASLASVALALLGALLIQRRLHRPLARVVDAAHLVGQGRVPTPLSEDGPSEVAALSRSFNQMTAAVAQAERERALMLAGVSHDLRTPLTKLRLAVEIIAPMSEPALLATMTRSIGEMDAIVAQFLDFARTDDNEPAVEGQIDAIARLVTAAFLDHGQAVAFTPGAPPRSMICPEALQRCLTNLIENAFRHGQPPVTLRTGVAPGVVWLEVSDAGNGMAAADTESLRQPLRRGQGARSGTPGAGLELVIVDRLVPMQRGRLDLVPILPAG